MGVRTTLYRATQAQIDAIAAAVAAAEAEDDLDDDAEDEDDDEDDEDHTFDVLEAIAEEDQYEVDTAWHGLHYLLTGTGAPGLSFVYDGQGALGGELPYSFLLAGRTLAIADEGWGMTLLAHDGAEVGRIAAALAALPSSELRKRFDPDGMMAEDVYPGTWDRGRDEVEWLIDAYEAMVPFLVESARRGCGLLVNIG
jgi:hypothetical protein